MSFLHGTTNLRFMANIKPRTDLLAASKKGDVETILWILQRRPDLVNDKSLYGNAPLHNACANGQLQVVQLLVQEGKADVKLLDAMGRTPLERAVNNGHVNVVEWLVKEGGACVTPDAKELLSRFAQSQAINNSSRTAAARSSGKFGGARKVGSGLGQIATGALGGVGVAALSPAVGLVEGAKRGGEIGVSGGAICGVLGAAGGAVLGVAGGAAVGVVGGATMAVNGVVNGVSQITQGRSSSSAVAASTTAAGKRNHDHQDLENAVPLEANVVARSDKDENTPTSVAKAVVIEEESFPLKHHDAVVTDLLGM